MKIETVEKVLKRYAKGLQVMEDEAMTQNESKDAERYRLDKNAMCAVSILCMEILEVLY